jgi:hypothetical protein
MSQEIIGALKALKLHGMAANYPEVAAQARPCQMSSRKEKQTHQQ